MKRKIVFLWIMFGFTMAYTQHLVVSDDSTYVPSEDDALLEVHSANNNKGFLPPQISLQSATSTAPVNNPRPGLLVFNIASASSGADTVYPGYYYWNGQRWTRLIDNPYQGIIFGHIATDTNRIDTIPATGTSEPRWTGSYIDLPPGIWVINATILIPALSSHPVQNGDGLWVRATFCESPGTYAVSGDIISSTLISGSLSGPSLFGLANGSIAINNTSGTTKRYYFWISISEQYGSRTQDYYLNSFGCGNWGENQIFAIPVR